MSVRSLCSWISALDPGQVEKFVASDSLANPFSRILSGFDRRRALARGAEADDAINPKAGILQQLPERVNDE
jgi:hypothetical protein